MFMEVAEIQVKPGTETAFEAAVQAAVPLFQRAKGCSAMRLERSVEQPSHYSLLVQWATVENHMVDFRESADFDEWRKLVGEFFAAPPQVGHTATVVKGF
ncbi:antibiotic biosynthesis monooxygenase family protein [Massilia sp. TWP1-3-3]|uniref:antibiotic biosynthesis monooxygenase family protein n=1 Tax=Massilia sp. TWP1-3-3 TaxID=2804573 RepID=UPI003CF085C9